MDRSSPVLPARLLRVSEVAQILGVGTGRVYKLIRNRQIPSVRVASAIRIPEDVWQEWVKRRTSRPLGG